MIVDLYPWEIELAYQVGIRRDNVNATKPDAAHYDRSRMEDNLRASVAAAACELAVARATCCYWTMSIWDTSQHYKYKALPDVLPNIEVKRVREPENPMVVRRREVGTGMVIVSAYAVPSFFRSVEIKGWLPADEAWSLGKPAAYDTANSRVVDQEQLRPIGDLTAEALSAA